MSHPAKIPTEPTDRTPAPLDPAFVERIKESLADPRPNLSGEAVRAHLKAVYEDSLKRDA